MSWFNSFLRMVTPYSRPTPPDIIARVAQLEEQMGAQQASSKLIMERVGNITKHLGLDEVIEDVADAMK